MDLGTFSAQLAELRDRALAAVAGSDTPDELDAVESAYLGRKGELRTLLGGIGGLPAEDRPRVGALANPAREQLESAIAHRRERLESIALEVRLAAERIDVTLPGRPLARGSLHPIRETEREIARIFGQFGFVVYEGPEVETDELNFQLLNIPEDHPARDLWDTIYVKDPAGPTVVDNAGPTSATPRVDTTSLTSATPGVGTTSPTIATSDVGATSLTSATPGVGTASSDGRASAPPTGPRYLLRTHTSPGQIRVMRQTGPPIRALLPGRCFRYEAVDASHGFEFFQVEGLMVDEGTTMATLRGLLDAFAHAMFGAHRPTRFRPGYYPFTEPSVAFDIQCVVCNGSGCPACGRTGWMTILGAGMVHPVVLRNGGIDPERYQGFAFGLGTDRIAMLRYAIPDIRAFLTNDLRFLERF
jgi:phenylalanyl-tRNA synthetase alpha chain